MAKPVPYILKVLILILFFARCAQVAPLDGGKRDTTPPKLEEAIPGNLSSHFNSDVITLKFDEFVQVKDLSGQLIISPKLKTAPEIMAEGKKIKITLKKEELAPNTTYRFFFGKAIADMHESNSLPDFEYVFSTGDFIDSLKLTGTVKYAFNNKLSGNVLVGLYHQTDRTDSIPYIVTPDYIARSNESGEFVFMHLPVTTFMVYAFTDKNKNNLYDGETEKIAFLDPDLKIVSDTNIQLRIFQEEASKSFVRRTTSPYYGFSRVLLNKKAMVQLSPLNKSDLPNISETLINKEKDTIDIFYKDIQDTLKLLVHNLSNKKTDSLKIILPKYNSAKNKHKSFTTNLSDKKLPLHDNIILTFQTWMDTNKVDMTKIRIGSSEDFMLKATPTVARWRNITTFEVAYDLDEDFDYTLKIDTNAFFDIKGVSNDSGSFRFKPQSKLEFGKARIKLRLNKKQNYIIQLINDQEQLAKQEFISFSLSASNATTIDFTDVRPGTYYLKIIFDDNKNNKWDTGNLNSKIEPEKVIINSKQLKVLSDWEIEEEIIIKD